MLSDWMYRLRALLRRSTVERELEDELRFHIEQETAKYVRTGENPEAGLSLALGIGANTAVFTVICGELYPVLTYPDTARLVKLVGVTSGANTPPHSPTLRFSLRQASLALKTSRR